MNFDLSEDQALLKTSAERLFRHPAQDAPELWSRMVQMGLPAAQFHEDHGGLGLGPIETMIVAEAAGAAGLVSPYCGMVAAGTALRLAPAPPAPLIMAVAAGEDRLAWAHDEADRASGAPRQVSCVRLADGWRLSGAKTNVLHAAAAGKLVVTATLEEAPCLVVVPIDAAGVSRRDYVVFDGAPASEIRFAEVKLTTDALLARGPEAERLIEQSRQHYTASRAAEAVGMMQAMLDATLDHLKTRRQFGQALAEFQALRHKAADMLIALEQARSMAIYAALSLDQDDQDDRRRAMAQVRSVVAKSSRLVGQTAVQLHGGVGVTEEHAVGRGFRRLTMVDLEMERG